MQPLPMRCFECNEAFGCRESVYMEPWISEGDVLSVGPWPLLRGERVARKSDGRVLWAAWFCADCGILRRHRDGEELEPTLIREQRLYAERRLAAATSASARTRAIQRAQAARYR